MNVAHFVDQWLRPSETFILSQAKGVILTSYVIPGSPAAKAYGMGPMERLAFLASGRSAALEKTVNDEKIELIHAHFGTAGRLILNTARRCAVPLVTSFYGRDCYAYPVKNPSAYKKLFEEGATFLALGKEMKASLIALGCPGEKITVHHLGVPAQPAIRRKPKSKVVFLSVARFIEKKGIEYAIKAFAMLRKELDCELRLVGNGPLLDELKAAASGVEDVVFIDNFAAPEPRKIVEQEMKAADVFVLPSVTARDGDREGTPVVLMEASSFSLPCLSTMHSDIPEVVENGKTGYLVPERDVHALYEKMKLLASSPAKRATMGKKAREKMMKEFNDNAQAKRLRKIYASLLTIHSAQRGFV